MAAVTQDVRAPQFAPDAHKSDKDVALAAAAQTSLHCSSCRRASRPIRTCPRSSPARLGASGGAHALAIDPGQLRGHGAHGYRPTAAPPYAPVAPFAPFAPFGPFAPFRSSAPCAPGCSQASVPPCASDQRRLITRPWRARALAPPSTACRGWTPRSNTADFRPQYYAAGLVLARARALLARGHLITRYLLSFFHVSKVLR